MMTVIVLYPVLVSIIKGWKVEKLCCLYITVGKDTKIKPMSNRGITPEPRYIDTKRCVLFPIHTQTGEKKS